MLIKPFLAMIGSAQFALSGPHDCHVYAVRGPEGIVLIDSGSGLCEEEIAHNLSVDFPGVPVCAILLTHAHMDHSGGALGLRRRFRCPILASNLTQPILEAADEERSGLRRAREIGTYPSSLHMTPFELDSRFQDGEPIHVAGLQFTAIHVRGHSADSFCLWASLNGETLCFCGDVVFYGGILGVINSHDSGMEGYRKDLPKLRGLSVDMLLPGHGLFTLKKGQRHIDSALSTLNGGFLPPQIGQGAIIF
ncbi:MAG TPA: MBL fold metallo-hydrolase [Acidobacteriaceae bacterium]|nr:MBL fold metallo-hydrolase [Acidobacteriaceae bacterium]